MSCYMRPNERATKSTPCDHDALRAGNHTQCCEPGDKCLSNGLCREETVNDATNYASRFACTDKTFKDPTCGAQYCDRILDDELWCCQTGPIPPYEDRVNRTNTSCCSIKSLQFKAANPTVFTTASLYGSVFSIATLLPSSISNRSSVITTPSPSNSLPITSSSSSAPAVPAAGTPTLAIGLGAGIGSFAAILLGIGSFCLWRRRKTVSGTPKSTTPANELSENSLAEVPNQDIAEMTGREYRAQPVTSPVSPVELWTPVERVELDSDVKSQPAVAELYNHKY
ncbi:hypothetical protein GQ44DRAFT_758549 [Phaeosphaeriaceae sp. PMI808]|nr:hypothetical protein GQ44DRAFT_758549 [Phaeosphaeriaceae sp. PMI808]